MFRLERIHNTRPVFVAPPETTTLGGFLRTCRAYSQERFMGINPLVDPTQRSCIHQRLHSPTVVSQDRCLNQKHEKSHRRARNMQIGGDIGMLVLKMQTEELETEIKSLTQKFDGSLAYAQEQMMAIGASYNARVSSVEAEYKGQLEHLTTRCEEYETKLQMESQTAEAAERCRKVAVASLRQRWQIQRAELEEEVRCMKDAMQNQERENGEARWLLDESMKHIKHLEKSVGSLEKGASESRVSRQLSRILSDIGEVALVRAVEKGTVEEKISEVAEAVKDMVKELISRRKSSARATEKLFQMEEERVIWERNEEAATQVLQLNALLQDANLENARLRAALERMGGKHATPRKGGS